MKKYKNIYKKYPFIITVGLFLVIIVQLIYYFNPQFQFSPAKKAGNPIYSSIDVLTLKGWTEQVKFLENITVKNATLSLNNTSGHAKDGYFNYVNRTDAIPYKKGMEIELRLKKTKGDKVSVNFATAIPENNNEWWTMQKGIEVRVLDDGDIYLNHYVEDRKNKDELYYIGFLPKDGFITLDFSEDRILSVQDKEGNEIGAAMFDKDPFEGVGSLYPGLSAGPESALEVSRFKIQVP